MTGSCFNYCFRYLYDHDRFYYSKWADICAQNYSETMIKIDSWDKLNCIEQMIGKYVVTIYGESVLRCLSTGFECRGRAFHSKDFQHSSQRFLAKRAAFRSKSNLLGFKVRIMCPSGWHPFLHVVASMCKQVKFQPRVSDKYKSGSNLLIIFLVAKRMNCLPLHVKNNRQ